MDIILGGTHGLGFELVEELQRRGEDTFAIGRSYDSARHGAGMAVDLAKREDVEKLMGFMNNLGETALRGFFWVSAYGYQGDFAAQPDVLNMAQVNFTNVLPIAQLAWAKMTRQDVASDYVIVSSTSGVKARQNEAVYAATKHAQVGFGRSLGLESERLNSHVKVSLFMPGGMQTPFWKDNEPAMFNEFLDPAKVAARICDTLGKQQNHYYEETIERGSL